MLRVVVLVCISLGLGIAGLFLWRSALADVGGFRLDSMAAVTQFGKLLLVPKFWLGAVVLFGVVLISLELYGSAQLSRVVPIYSLGYIAMAIVDRFVFHAPVPPTRWAGVGLVMAGVVLISRA